MGRSSRSHQREVSVFTFNNRPWWSLGLGIFSCAWGAAVTIAQTVPPDVVVDTPQPPPSPTNPTTTNAKGDRRFTCEVDNGSYVVMYHPQEQKGKAYAWARPQGLGGGWTEAKRCEAIASRLESYRPDGLTELRTGQENNYNVVCATTQKDASCRIVLTVPPGQDALMTRNQVFENLTLADKGQQTQGVNTYMGNGADTDWLDSLGNLGNLGNLLGGQPAPVRGQGINLKPFLSPSDGGTGQGLNGLPVRGDGGKSLNPDRFR